MDLRPRHVCLQGYIRQSPASRTVRPQARRLVNPRRRRIWNHRAQKIAAPDPGPAGGPVEPELGLAEASASYDSKKTPRKGSIVLNSAAGSGHVHGKPRVCFFFGSPLKMILYVAPVPVGIVSGRNRTSRKRKNKTVLRGAGPNFDRTPIASFAAFKKKDTSHRVVCQAKTRLNRT